MCTRRPCPAARRVASIGMSDKLGGTLLRYLRKGEIGMEGLTGVSGLL